MKRPTTSRDAALAAGIFILSFGYYFLFRHLGWFMQDEGVLYYQYLRTYQGQLPYRDFFTGYPPLAYYFHALIFDLFGISITTIRTVMAVVNAGTAAGLYLVARRIAPRWAALLPSLLFMVMQPGDITDMSFHNSPYPSWYALMFLTFTTWSLLRALETGSPRRRSAWLFLTGILGGLTFFSKQNAGIFILWGVSGYLVSVPSVEPRGAGEPPFGRNFRRAYLALIPMAAALLIAKFLSPITILLFVAPTVLLGVLGARTVFSPPAWRAMARDMLLVGAGFAAIFLPWLLYFGSKIGAGVYLRELFLLGKNVDENLFIPLPAAGPLTLAILAVAGLIVLAAFLRRRGALRAGRRPALLDASDLRAGLVAALALGAGAALARLDVIKDLLALRIGLGEIYMRTSGAMDNLLGYLAALVLAAALALAWRQAAGRGDEGDPPPRAFRAILWCAACAYILYFPRMDSAHLYVGAAPLLYVVGAALLPRARTHVVRAFAPASGRRAALAFNVACVLLFGFIIVPRTMPQIYSLVSVRSGPSGVELARTEAEHLHLPRTDLYFPVYLDSQRDPIRSFDAVVRYVRETTAPDDPIFAFPAIPMIYFASERSNPTRQDYFFGNNVTFQDQLDVVRKLEKARVPLVITVNDPNEYFVSKGKRYTRLVRNYIADRYYLERHIGRFDIMRRYDLKAKETLEKPRAAGSRRPSPGA